MLQQNHIKHLPFLIAFLAWLGTPRPRSEPGFNDYSPGVQMMDATVDAFNDGEAKIQLIESVRNIHVCE
jgi:hypothetical protein